MRTSDLESDRTFAVAFEHRGFMSSLARLCHDNGLYRATAAAWLTSDVRVSPLCQSRKLVGGG
jgi:hypothetical protein